MGDTAGRVGPTPSTTIYGGTLGELDQIDQAVYRAIAATPSPSLDRVLSQLSSAADHSKLWFAVAAALARKPGRPRRAALLGVASIGLASATANLVGKGLLRRARPDRTGLNVPAGRKVRMPGSTSFPSGHSASAFAFATAVGDELPLAWLPLHTVAAAITYSRVHTGVHYPGDVLVGSLMGTGAAVAVRYTSRALTRRRVSPPRLGPAAP
jgi:membrane-associated phospholipid phosphatase